jgi:hypothetical protein
MPYCSLAIMGLSEMKVKSLRRHVKGRGTIKAQKMAISVTKRRKTWKKNKSKHVDNIIELAAASRRAAMEAHSGNMPSRFYRTPSSRGQPGKARQHTRL